MPTLKRKLYYLVRDKIIPQGTRRRLFLNILLESTIKSEQFFSRENIITFMKLVCFFLYDRELAEKLLEKQGMAKPFRDVARSLSIQFVHDVRNISKQTFVFPNIDVIQVSIVIPVFNKWIYTYNCLHSLWLNRDSTSMEIIVVDNCSSDETSSLAENFENVKVLRNDENLGFVKACNLGAQAASGKYLLFLNNDLLVTDGLLIAMLDLANNDNTVGMIGAKLIYPNGALQEAGGIVWNDAVNIAWNYGRLNSPGRWEYNYVKEVDYCSGACLMIRTRLFFDVGLFDERYTPAYFEDTDLAFKVREAGYKVMYQPAAIAIHFEGVTAGTDLSSGFKRFQDVNRSKFYGKWKSVLAASHLQVGEDVFLARDRSQSKKVVLYVDHQIPTFDQDAGSKITYEYLKLFANLNFKVIFWPDPLQKIEPYTSTIQQMGIEVVYGYGSLKSFLKKHGRHIDYAFLSRPLVARQHINVVKTCCPQAKLLYVAHDLHFLREMRRAEIEGNRTLKYAAKQLKHIEMDLMEKSDLTLVFSNVEKRILEAEERRMNVQIMPWIQDLNNHDVDFDERRNLMFIGGFVHQPNKDGMLWFAKAIFPRIRKKINGIKLIIIGSKPTVDILALQSNDIFVAGYVQDPTENFKSSRVFVAPLRYGAGVKGKILEAMSYGLPVVTTAIGVEGLDLEPGKNVLVANEPDEYADAVVSLYSSKELWLTLSQNGLHYVNDNHSANTAKIALCRMLGITNG
jgi:O-antigen biosynthesis protein